MTRRRATPAGRPVTDPTVIFWAFVHRHLPGHARDDPRLLLLREIDHFADAYGLDVPGDAVDEWPYSRGGDVNLVQLHRSQAGYERLVSLLRHDTEELLACLAYGYL